MGEEAGSDTHLKEKQTSGNSMQLKEALSNDARNPSCDDKKFWYLHVGMEREQGLEWSQ